MATIHTAVVHNDICIFFNQKADNQNLIDKDPKIITFLMRFFLDKWISCIVTCCGELLISPLQGSFFTRNSSRAIQPPPTRTITVLRKIRTKRSCWESPNYSGREGRGGTRDVWKPLYDLCLNTHCRLNAIQHWKPDWFGESHLFQKKKKNLFF